MCPVWRIGVGNPLNGIPIPICLATHELVDGPSVLSFKQPCLLRSKGNRLERVGLNIESCNDVLKGGRRGVVNHVELLMGCDVVKVEAGLNVRVNVFKLLSERDCVHAATGVINCDGEVEGMEEGESAS